MECKSNFSVKELKKNIEIHTILATRPSCYILRAKEALISTTGMSQPRFSMSYYMSDAYAFHQTSYRMSQRTHVILKRFFGLSAGLTEQSTVTLLSIGPRWLMPRMYCIHIGLLYNPLDVPDLTASLLL